MRTGLIRRFVGAGSAASLLAFAGLSSAGVAPVAAQGAAECTVSGSATITPGLDPVPKLQNFSFTGTTTCTGVLNGSAVVNAGGTFGGSGTCQEDSIEVGAVCNISFTATVAGVSVVCSASVGYTHVGPFVEVHCQVSWSTATASGTGVIWAHVVFTPNPPVQNPVTTVNFTGVAEVVLA